MLILTRRPGERVVIGDEILVTVMGISGHTVRLGIEAPGGVPIYREEIWLAVREENRAAAAAPDIDVPPAPRPPAADAPSAQPPADDAPSAERSAPASDAPSAERSAPASDSSADAPADQAP